MPPWTLTVLRADDSCRPPAGRSGFAWLAANWPQVAAAAQHGHEMATAVAADRSRFQLLTPAQARDVEAIAAQIIPSGSTPGAREAGVVYFIDHIHAGAWSGGAKDFIAGLDDFQVRCARHHPRGRAVRGPRARRPARLPAARRTHAFLRPDPLPGRARPARPALLRRQRGHGGLEARRLHRAARLATALRLLRRGIRRLQALRHRRGARS